MNVMDEQAAAVACMDQKIDRWGPHLVIRALVEAFHLHADAISAFGATEVSENWRRAANLLAKAHAQFPELEDK